MSTDLSEIHIQGAKFKNNRLTNSLNLSKKLKRFIKTPEMFIEYDTDIHADESILNIPLTATVLPLAWLTGSDIFLNTLDRDFKESMDTLQSVFKSMFPLPPFSTEIHSEELVVNKINPIDPERRTGLLFSGGVDSTYSMITHQSENPRLIMHWGVEGPPYPVYRNYWEMVNRTYKDFANKNELAFNLTKTNVLEILDPRKIEHRFHKELYYGSLWVRLQHSLVLLSLVAPLSMNRFDRLLIAASNWRGSRATVDPDRPHSQRPETDERIGWAGLSVKHDGYIPRNKKIKVIGEHINSNKLTLRACLARPGDQTTPEKMNCNNCSKCHRTIMQLVQFQHDPEELGFSVDDSTFNKIREYYSRHGLDSFGINSQTLLPENFEHNFYGSRCFFEWLKNFKLTDKDLAPDIWVYRGIYDSLPYPLAKIVNVIYKKFDINIHFGNPILPQEKVNILKALAEKKGRMPRI
jgi:hypothetical protein